jgi:YVTN family beta-propeller protein
MAKLVAIMMAVLTLATHNVVIANQTISVGQDPFGVAQGDGRVFVTNKGDHTISVIDTATNQVIQTISVGQGTLGFIAYGDGRLYVPDTIADTTSVIFVIDAVSGKTLQTINLSSPVTGVAYAEGFIYAAELVSGAPKDCLAVIDANSGQLIQLISIDVYPLGVTYGQGRIYVANTNTGTVSVIDAATRMVIQTIDVDSLPSDIVYADGYVYVANNSSNSLSVIDATTSQVTKDISCGPSPYGVTYGNGKVYVSNTYNFSGPCTVTVIDPISGTVIETIPVGKAPYCLKFDPKTGNVYVANAVDNTVTVISPSK